MQRALASLTSEEVARLLINLDLQRYAESFRKTPISGADLILMTDEDLQLQGIDFPLHRRRLKVQIDGFAENGVPPSLLEVQPAHSSRGTTPSAPSSRPSTAQRTGGPVGRVMSLFGSRRGSPPEQAQSKPAAADVGTPLAQGLNPPAADDPSASVSITDGTGQLMSAELGVSPEDMEEGASQSAGEANPPETSARSEPVAPPVAASAHEAAEAKPRPKAAPSAGDNSTQPTPKGGEKGGEKVEQEDEEDDEDDFTGWFGFGGDSLTSAKDALSQTFDMRLGELPNQVEVFADNNEPILIPELAQEPSSKLFHLVLPPGGYVKFTPAVKPRDSYASHLYWSVYFDVQYTLTGEGGGFALFTPWDEVTEGTVPFFVRHVDGVLSTDTPPMKAPDVQVAVESEDPEVLQKAKKEALKQRLEEAADKSKEWHRITVTGGYDTDTITLYVDGLETARKSIYFSSEEYPCFRKSFYLFACANKEFRPKHNVHVRLLTFKTGDPVMDKDSVFQESERVNHDLPIEKIESVLYERAMRRHLYVPQLPGRLRKAERQKRALTSFEPPTVWNHSVTLALFNVPGPGTLHNSWAMGDAIADLVDMVNVMVEREAGQQNDAIQPKVRTAFSNAMLLVRKSVKPEKLKGIGEEAARGESKISEWETNRRKAVTELRALDKLEEGQVHLIALKRPDLRFAIISKSRAQPQDGSSGSCVYQFTLISTSKMAFTHHPQRATGQRLLYNTCLELSGIDEQRMRSELWWTMFFMVAERNVGILYKSVLPWLVQRPLEDLESSNNESSEQGRGHWVLLPKEEDGKVLVTIFEALRYLMLSGGCSVEQVDRWFLQLQIHLVVACASDLEFFQPSTNTLEEKAAAAVSHMSKTIAFDVVQQKDYPVKTLHHLQQALHSIQKQLRAHANMRRPAAPALLTLRPTRKLEQQHLHWGFDTLVPHDVSELAGDSSFDKTLSGLKAVSFFESGLKLLHGESAPDVGEDKPCLNFSDCLQAMQKCLELCLQLSNLEDVKWRSHLMCAALADTFLKQLPLPLPASHKMGCVWASMTDVGEVVPKVAYTLELLRQLMELLAFASGSGALTGDDAAEWHSTLVCVSGAIAAISDAVARSGADNHDAPRLAALLCGKLGSLHALAGAPGGGSEDLHEGKEISYSIGSRSFEARTNSLVLTPDLCLARKHILEYFCGLNVDPENELFDVEAADHYSSKMCPTRLFFVALSQNIYCRSGAALAIIDVDNDMQHATSGHTAFRDIMMYWKIFTLTCDPTSPFECAGCKHRKNFSLVFQRPQENTGPYSVGTQFERDGSKEFISFLFNGCSKPIRPVQLTATNPTFHTSPHNVENEDDVLHLRRLPDFDGRLRPHGVELLLQYLTVPYLRIPLILDFFSEDTIYALQSSKLQELIERVLFEPGPFGSNDELTEPLAEVPCKNRERVTCTSFGLLFNELVHNGGRLVDSITSLLKLSLKYDAYRADDSMSSVILFITRLAVRIEQAATLVLSPDQVPSHDRRLLAPRDPHGLLSRLIELRVLLRNTVTPVLKAWVADLEKGHGSGGQSAKHTSLKCDVHAHLLYLHSNLQPYQFSKEAVTLVLTSFMQIMHGYSGATILHVPLCALFQIFHQLRVRLIAWLEADSRRTLDLQEVLNLTYEAATGQLADGENGWAKMREMKNRGRYALLDLTSESDTVPSTRERAGSVAKSPLVNEENETTVAELNLQVMQVAAAGAVIKPLPEAYKTNQDVVEVLASFGALQAAVEDVRKNMSRYHIVGRGVWLELWNKDETLKQLKELNEKEKNKKKKLLDGEEIGDEFQMNEGQERWLASVGHLVRDSLRTTYTRKLDYKLVMSPLSYTFGGTKPTTTTEQPLKDHERWVYDLMDAADLTGQSFASFRNFGNFGGIPGNDGERQKEDEKKKLFEKVSFYLPDEIDPDADIVRLVGGSEESEIIEIGDKTFGKQMFTYAGRYTSCTFEAYVQRRLNLVHVYQRVSHGREYFRTLVYSSNSELALVQLPKVRDSNNESDTGFSYLSGEYREKQERKAKIQRTEALKSNGSTDLLADPSCVITRNPPKLAGLPAAARRERYIPKWLLFGVLPENLLDEYHFYRQEKPAGAAQSTSTELRGYAVRGSDSLSPHVLLVQLTEAKLRIFGGGNSSMCAVVKKRTLDGSVNDMMLLNLLTAEPNDDLSALGRVLMRLEHLAHILVWSTVHPHQNSRDQQFMVDLVELPRLQLSFKSKASKSDGESPRLYSVEMPQLYVYRPPKGEWPEDILHLVEDVPHGLVMLSDTQQLLLLVPNLKINRRGSVLIPERNEQWERSAITPYFIYEVHVSKQFFITTSLASALYLCIMRFLSEDYAACFILVDSIATDRAFDEEEQQIFELLALTDQRSHPNASACLCKIALAVEDAPVQLPVSIGYHAAVFVSSKPLISARCRLSEEEELRLMQLIHEQQLRATAADSVLKQSDNVIVKAATAGATPKPGAQAKMVEELHKNISAAASEAGVTMQMHEVPLLVTDWLNQQNERGAQLADAYDLKVLTNRRKQLCFRNAGIGSSMTPEDLIYAAHRNVSDQKITGKSYTFARINAVLQTPAENWAKLNLRYDMERRITAQKLSDVVAKLIESPDSLDGTQHELGFLFLYDLMSGQMEVEANALNSDPSSQHELATLLIPFFSDTAPSSERQATSMLAELVALLASNKELVEVADRPRLDGSAFDGSEDSKIWRAQPIEKTSDEEDAKLPLGVLLEKLMEWLPQQRGLKWPAYISPAVSTFPVSADVLELGLFARRPIGVAVSDSACDLRKLERANLQVLQPTMTQLGIHYQETDLPLDISRQPMKELLAMKPGFTEEEKVVNETRASFGYNLENHRRVQTHIIAKSVVSRMQKDMAAFSFKEQNSTKLRVRDINKEFERLLGALCTSDQKNRLADCKKALGQIEKASQSLALLQAALGAGQQKELEQVSNAIVLLGRLANHCSVPSPDTPAPHGLPDSEWRSKMLSRYHFSILHVGELDTDIDFTFIVQALLSRSAAEDWADINPFIDGDVQNELSKLAATMLLHASAISSFNLLIVETSKLQGMLASMRTSIDELQTAVQETPGDKAVLGKIESKIKVATSGVVNLADSVASSLHVERHYISRDFTYDPRLLVFEFIRSLVLRRGQVEIAQDFILALRDDNIAAIADGAQAGDDGAVKIHRLAVQVLMGQGKTAVITPLLCLLLADGERVPIVLLPDSLLDAARNIIRSTFASVINKRVFTLECSRASTTAHRYLNMIQNAIKYKGVVITTPTSAKSAILKFLENLISLNDDSQIRGKRAIKDGPKPLPRRLRAALESHTGSWANLLQQFRSSVLIMDELDWVCHREPALDFQLLSR
ncbi:hypothetical protein AB1Y20_014561 [Prymnesium parvum]|uniref:ubiquitinyl hydrolase 1 n=1 Tax=Prymnesium parvum TaxID=97485 RepID=A0AB34IED0_PRYPA